MSVNGSSNNGGRDPWRRPKEEGPPDLIQLIKNIFNKTSQKTSASNLGGSAGFGSVIVAVILILIVVWALLGIYLVNPAEQAVVLRFGKYIKTVGPGPHWLPRFIDSEQKVNVQQIKSFPYHAEMLSKDENIVSVKLQVQYRIDNPHNFLFNVVDPEKTLQQAVSSALRQMVGQMDLDPLITTGRQQLTEQVTAQLKQILSNYQIGIEVVDVALQEVKPPTAVTAAFDDVVKAREDRQSYINKANAYAKNRVLLANGIAARLEQEANAYFYIVVAKAKGESARFLALLTPFQQSPVVTSKRLYLETMSYILNRTQNVIVNGNNLIYLPINQMLNNSGLNKIPVTPLKTSNARLSNHESSEADENDVIEDNEDLNAGSNSNTESTPYVYPDRPSYSNEGGVK